MSRTATARSRLKRRLGRALPLAAGVLLSLAIVNPAEAAEGSIDHVKSRAGVVQVLYSIPGASKGVQPDLSSLSVSLDGTKLESQATLAAQAQGSIRRTTVLAIDVSDSMRSNGKFKEARRAAQVFLDSAPDDVYVGIVTFAGIVKVAQPPSLDRAASKQVIDGLTLSQGTRLYDGVKKAVTTSGKDGLRSVLVLSDGRDTSKTTLASVIDVVKPSKVKVDVVALAQSAADEALLRRVSDAGGGSEIKADNPKALSEVFASEAETLAKQILITAVVPSDLKSTEGTLSVSIAAGGEAFDDSAFVTVTPAKTKAAAPTTLVPAKPGGVHVSSSLMFAGLLAAGVGVLALLLGVLGGVGGNKPDSVEDRVEAYTRAGAAKLSKRVAQQGQQGMTAQAVGVAAKALEGSKGFEATLSTRLEAAGMSMKPAEWLLLHSAVAFAFGILALMISSGSILGALVGLAVGVVTPWMYLSLKQSRRLRAFNAQLAETLQLMAGSLSAGLSLAQSVDTVVREGSDPMSTEFRRALVETRLGVEMENALESVATRMRSVDFEWVVMAVRIQREVGGNLAELLNNVAATIREREYLHRQVQALSAEGRLSVWILGGLPPTFISYLALVNPTYLQPLVSTFIGWCMVGTMIFLIVVGVFWMKKLVKIKV